MIGIVSYGCYIPRFRIKTEEIAKTWMKDPQHIKDSLGIYSKSVAGQDEDVLTMAYESASRALHGIDFDRSHIDALYVGSENHPYVVNPTSTILAEHLQIGNDYLAYDTQFACKAATGALRSGFAMVESGEARYALVAASDKATGKPGDALEYSAGSASASFLLGKKDVAAEYIDSVSYSSDTPDFWRRHGQEYPSHGGRFTGEPAYFKHISESVGLLNKKTGMKISDYTFTVFHTPNAKFPKRIAKKLGCSDEQMKHSLIVKEVGNSYAASVMVTLSHVLDHAKKGDTILVASYGSGAGSDAFGFRATGLIEARKQHIADMMGNNEDITYSQYMKFMNMV